MKSKLLAGAPAVVERKMLRHGRGKEGGGYGTHGARVGASELSALLQWAEHFAHRDLDDADRDELVGLSLDRLGLAARRRRLRRPDAVVFARAVCGRAR